MGIKLTEDDVRALARYHIPRKTMLKWFIREISFVPSAVILTTIMVTEEFVFVVLVCLASLIWITVAISRFERYTHNLGET